MALRCTKPGKMEAEAKAVEAVAEDVISLDVNFQKACTDMRTVLFD